MNWQMLKHLANRVKTPQGVTLLESLVAMTVVGVLLTAIAPLIALSAAARVQARRVDQATQAARGFIDAVASQSVDVRGAYFPSALIVPASMTCPGGGTPYSFDCVAAPGGSGISASDLDAIPGVKIDGNGNGFSVFDPQDFVIQPMRNDNIVGGFQVAVRVYRADAFLPNGGNPAVLGATTATTGLQKGYEDACASAQIVFTASLGSRVCPLVFMQADIIGR
jgi:prepilin-type N-terminal cleavage/methylation domain-containing protein